MTDAVEREVAELLAAESPDDPVLHRPVSPEALQRLYAIRDRMRERNAKRLRELGYTSMAELTRDLDRMLR